MNKKDQRIALLGWGAGAFVAIAAYVSAVQFFPPAPSGSLVATLAPSGIDPIFTGSIDTPSGHRAPLPFGSPLQAQIDQLTLDIAALKDAVGATQAASLSTNRRLEVLEGRSTLTTASVNATDASGSDQPLPEVLDPVPLAQTEPRVVLPAPVQVDGGAIAVVQSPLRLEGMVDTPEPSSAQDSPRGSDAAVLSQTPFAVDLGGATTLEALDSLWLAHQEVYGDTLQGMTPRILLQQTSDGALDLRLVAGPIDDAADAALLCAQLVAAGMERCLPAIFDGQRLALR